MSDRQNELPLPTPPESSSSRWERWRKRAIGLFTEPIKLPGWAAAVLAVIIIVPDWHSRFKFWFAVVKGMGGYAGMIASAIASPYFSPALFVSGLLWVLFVGEPKKGVQRRHWLRYVGWSVFSICLTTVIAIAGYGAIEFYIQQQVSARDRALQDKIAVRPVFWRLTDAQKTSLKFALDKIPENERFEIDVQCLPDAGSRAFVEDLAALFIDRKWKIKANCLFSRMRPDLTGLYIGLSSTYVGKQVNEFPKQAQVLAALLQTSNVSFQWIRFDIDGMKPDQTFLIVGNAP